jgi:hypothetical protein
MLMLMLMLMPAEAETTRPCFVLCLSSFCLFSCYRHLSYRPHHRYC